MPAYPRAGKRATYNVWGFPKIRGIFLGVPIIRTIVFWGLYWGPPILGNYHIILIFQLFSLHGDHGGSLDVAKLP